MSGASVGDGGEQRGTIRGGRHRQGRQLSEGGTTLRVHLPHEPGASAHHTLRGDVEAKDYASCVHKASRADSAETHMISARGVEWTRHTFAPLP